MKTEPCHNRIDGYLSTLKTDSDKLTQFYDASIIAKNALIEVDRLEKHLLAIIQIAKTDTGFSAKQSMKHTAQRALDVEITDPPFFYLNQI